MCLKLALDILWFSCQSLNRGSLFSIFCQEGNYGKEIGELCCNPSFYFDMLPSFIITLHNVYIKFLFLLVVCNYKRFS